MEFRILGPLEVVEEGHPVPIGGVKQRALLALLLLRANEVISVDRLVEDLWEGDPPPSAHVTLRSHLARLRKLLGLSGNDHDDHPAPDRFAVPVAGHATDLEIHEAHRPAVALLGRKPGYMVQLDPNLLDAVRFEQLVAKGHKALTEGSFLVASSVLREALGLWRGPALADFASASWAQTYAAQLEELRLTALEDRVDADLNLGRHGELVGELEALVAEHALREHLWGQLVIALYRCRRQAEALRAYQRLRTRLADELGIDPSPELKGLEEAVLLQAPELDWTPSTARRARVGAGSPVGTGAGEARPPDESSETTEQLAPLKWQHNVPVSLTSFVGREVELHEVSKLTEAHRLVTLTGFGGGGKTRLAFEVAAGLVERWRDGVWVVDLASLTDPDLVPHAVARALAVREEPDRALIDTLVDELRRRELLIVLDNCEHLVAACAHLVETLLRACPGLRVLATSREPLGVPGELNWRMPPLSVPDPSQSYSSFETILDYEAVRLFVDRARMARPELSLDDDDVSSLVAICARLDGIPLAIELAAARVGMLSVNEIAARLDHRFSLLVTGNRVVPPRHQTLWATLEWSHSLLSLPEQVLLRRLAVFVGGLTLEAVEAVCSGPPCAVRDDALDLLGRLVAKSLVVMEMPSGTARYRLLETVRQYAREKLIEAGEDAEMATRHRDWYLAMAEETGSQVFGAEGGQVLDRLEAEHGNFRAALQWSVDNPDSDVPDSDDEAGLRLAHALYVLWVMRSHRREGYGWMKALLAGRTKASAMASAVTRRMANLLWWLGDLETTMSLYQQAADLARACGDRRHLGRALTSMADLVGSRGQLKEARALLEESQAIARETHDQAFLVQSLLRYGWAAQRQARYAEARQHAEESQAIHGGMGWYHRARVLQLLGTIEREEGNYASARLRLEECRAIAASAGHRELEAMALEALGSVAAAQGACDEARSAYEQALSLVRELPQASLFAPLAGLGELASAEGNHDRARALLEEGVNAARQSGDVSLVVWALNRLGAASLARGDTAAATRAYEEALDLGHRAGMLWHVASSLEGLAALNADTQPERAARLFGQAERVRDAIGAPLPPLHRGAHERSVAAARSKMDDTAFAQTWKQGQALTLDEAVVLASPGNQRLLDEE